MRRVNVDPAQLDAGFASYDLRETPGFSIGIALHGEGVYRRGFGSARLNPSYPLSASSQMRIWSTTKQFTCFAVLLLAERRLLSLDHPVRDYIKELPKWADAISLRHLMGHISGMHCSTDILQLTSAFMHREAEDNCQLDLLVQLDDVNAPPGARFSYNNGGYCLLSEVIARVSGQGYANFLKSEVLNPIGLKDSFICTKDREAPLAVAQCYKAEGDRYLATPLGSTTLGEGGLVSTVDDMLRWMAHMDQPIIGSPESWMALRTAMCLNNGVSTGYAMGLMIGTYRGLATIGHTGAGPSGSAQMIRLPKVGLDIVVISNRADVSAAAIAEQTIDLCVDGLAPPLAMAEPPAKGSYFNRTTTQLLELDPVKGAAMNGSPLGPLRRLRPLRPLQDGRIWAAVNVTLGGALSLAADGDVLLLEEFGIQYRFEQIPLWIDNGFGDAIVGDYVCSALGATAKVERLSVGSVSLQIVSLIGDAQYDLTRNGQSIWTGRAIENLPRPNCLIEFDEDKLWLSSLRTTRLCFKRAV